MKVGDIVRTNFNVAHPLAKDNFKRVFKITHLSIGKKEDYRFGQTMAFLTLLNPQENENVNYCQWVRYLVQAYPPIKVKIT